MKYPNLFPGLIIAAGFLLLPNPFTAVVHTEPSETVTLEYFAENGYDKPVKAMQHPCAEYYKGVTTIAYQGPHEDPYVCAYDHTADQWTGPVKAGVSLLGDKYPPGKPDVDNHGRPALIVDNQGYIHLVFGGHGGHRGLGENPLGAVGSGRQTHVVSKHPQDISEWQQLDNISPFGTYSQFVKMDNGNIYLFYRHGSWRSDWVMQKSTDNGRTFTPPRSILKHKQRKDNPNIYDTWYAWFRKGRGETIHALINYHLCRVKGHTSERYNIYYMQMHADSEIWRTVTGEPLTLPVSKEQADKKILVFNTGNEQTRIRTCNADINDDPHLLFLKSGEFCYSRWLGSGWQDPVTVSNDYEVDFGDLEVDSPRRARVILAETDSQESRICWWFTKNGGQSWKKEVCLMRRPHARFDISAIILNAHPDALLVAAEKNERKAGLLRRLYLLGDRGLVRRTLQNSGTAE